MTVRTSNEADFASAAMMRLVLFALEDRFKQGTGRKLARSGSATVPRGMKHDVLASILDSEGSVSILRIADALYDVPSEPVLIALLKARTAVDFLERWKRLERFSHGRHIVQVNSISETRHSLLHRSSGETPDPSISETLLVIGVMAILIERVTNCEITLTDNERTTWRKHGRWVANDDSPPPGPFHIEIENDCFPTSIKNALSTEKTSDLASDVREELLRDPLRRWVVDDLAKTFAMSKRTMQRKLTKLGTPFSELVSMTRLQVAAEYLCTPNPSLAEIAFLSGYADQAHFTRKFTRSVGTTPALYRANFLNK